MGAPPGEDYFAFGPPLDEDDTRTQVDRRYLELHSQILDADGLRKIEPPSPLIDGYLFHDSLAWLGGKPGNAKTFGAVGIGCCVGTGTPWHGRNVAQGVVLYLIAEGASGLAQRVDAWALANGQPVRNVLFLPVPAQLMDYIDVTALAEIVSNLDVDLLILDTQARVTVGAEENSSRDMGKFVDNLEQIRRRTGACVLVVHHEPRNGENLRGSTALEGAATTILRVSKDGNIVELSNPKQKDSPEQPPMLLALTPIGDSAVLSSDVSGIAGFGTESEHQILTVLRRFGAAGASKTELRDASGLAKTTYYRSIGVLLDKGLVKPTKIGRSTVYTLPTDDRQQVTERSQQSHEAVGIVTTRPGVSHPPVPASPTNPNTA